MWTEEDMKIVRKILLGPQKKWIRRLRWNSKNATERESIDSELIDEKRHRVVGLLNTVVASEKWKQISINEADKKKYKELTHDHCAMWCYHSF